MYTREETDETKREVKMKKRRNSSIATCFWIILVLLFILGLITHILGITNITFPEEDSQSQISSTISQNVDSNFTPDESTTQQESTTNKNELENTEIISQPEESTSTAENETEKIPQETNPEETTSLQESKPAVDTTDEPPIETVPEETHSGTIYLTFDDGPSLSITPQILDILKSNNISATFFIVDYECGSEREELVKRAFNEGHTIALHGTSHQYSEIYSSLEALINNFETLQEKVFTSTGYRSYIIRFPGGSSNTVSKRYCTGIMTDAVEYFSTTDFVYFDWNVDSQDAGGAYSKEEIFENVTSTIKPNRSNIVLMHDSGSKKFTVEALQNIINWGIAEGYEFKAITQETPQVTHRIAN